MNQMFCHHFCLGYVLTTAQCLHKSAPSLSSPERMQNSMLCASMHHLFSFQLFPVDREETHTREIPATNETQGLRSVNGYLCSFPPWLTFNSDDAHGSRYPFTLTHHQDPHPSILPPGELYKKAFIMRMSVSHRWPISSAKYHYAQTEVAYDTPPRSVCSASAFSCPHQIKKTDPTNLVAPLLPYDVTLPRWY